MTKNQFIERQIYYSLHKGKDPRSVLESVLSATSGHDQAEKALKEYDNCHSISQVLQGLGIIDIDKSFLPILKEIEKNDSTSESITSILETKLIIKRTLQLMKARLNIGLSYALLLMSIASIVLYVTSEAVFDSFEVFFAETGAQLPAFTQLIINWQNSSFGPQLIAPILFVLIIFLLFVTKRSNEKEKSLSILNKIPFVNSIAHFAKNLNWITQLKILSKANQSLDDAKTKLKINEQLLNQYAPQIMDHLSSAEQLGNLTQEIEYQFENLTMNAELIVTKSSRNLVAVIMVLVVSFVAMTLIASYLPLFQLGAIV